MASLKEERDRRRSNLLEMLKKLRSDPWSKERDRLIELLTKSLENIG